MGEVVYPMEGEVADDQVEGLGGEGEVFLVG